VPIVLLPGATMRDAGSYAYGSLRASFNPPTLHVSDLTFKL
jgi:hypothetical protein